MVDILKLNFREKSKMCGLKSIYRDLTFRADNFCGIAFILQHVDSKLGNLIVTIAKLCRRININTKFIKYSCGRY